MAVIKHEEDTVLTLADVQNRKVPLKGIKRIPTMQVRRIRDGHTMIIGIGDFDETIHEKVDGGEAQAKKAQSAADDEARRREAARREQEIADEQKVTPYTKDQLGKMTVEALKMLPEYKSASASRRDKAKNKADIIALILQQRS